MRNSSVEFLRFLMMLLLCLWHIFMHGYGLKDMADGTVIPTYTQLMMLSLLAFPVDCFAFISGYYGIKLKREKIIRLLIQTTFFYLVCIVLRNMFHLGEPVPGGIVLTNLIPLTNRAWWFVAWYTALMLMSPILEAGIKTIGQNLFLKILIGIIVINNVGTWLNHLHTGSDFIGLLTIYLIGRYMNLYKKNYSKMQASMMAIFSTNALIIALIMSQYFNKPYFTWTFLMFCNPLIVIQAISVFYIAKNINIRYSKTFNFLGARCFAIYLVTEFTGNHLYNGWRAICETDGVCAMMLSLCIVCVLICIADYLQSLLQKPARMYILKLTSR